MEIISVDYREKIPNNVNLSGDKRLQRALEAPASEPAPGSVPCPPAVPVCPPPAPRPPGRVASTSLVHPPSSRTFDTAPAATTVPRRRRERASRTQVGGVGEQASGAAAHNHDSGSGHYSLLG